MSYSFISDVQKIQTSIERIKGKFKNQANVKVVLDGLIVNSLGKLYAMEVHKINLDKGDWIHHGKTSNGKLIRVTTTQGKTVILKKETDQLLVLQLKEKGEFKTIYFGSGKKAWGKDKSDNLKNKTIAISKLESL
jgi:hypothetical protein